VRQQRVVRRGQPRGEQPRLLRQEGRPARIGQSQTNRPGGLRIRSRCYSSPPNFSPHLAPSSSGTASSRSRRSTTCLSGGDREGFKQRYRNFLLLIHYVQFMSKRVYFSTVTSSTSPVESLGILEGT
jgi:hypothetical protein